MSNNEKISLWKRTWQQIVAWQRHTPREGFARSATHAPQLARLAPNDHEYAARVGMTVGVYPTERNELIVGLNVPRCRSPGVGAPQPTTGIRRGPLAIAAFVRTVVQDGVFEEIREWARKTRLDIERQRS